MFHVKLFKINIDDVSRETFFDGKFVSCETF